MGKSQAYNDLLRFLYLASAGLQDFNDSLGHVSRFFDSQFVAFLNTNALDLAAHVPFAVGMSVEQSSDYCQNWAHRNILIQVCISDLIAGRAVQSGDYFTNAEFARSPFFNEFMKGIDAFFNAGVVIGTHGDFVCTLVMGRGRDLGPYAADEVCYLAALKPHVEAALEINSHLNLLKSELAARTSALDQFTTGVCFLGADLKIINANQVARQALQEGRFVKSLNGSLAKGQVSSSELEKLLRAMSLGAAQSQQIRLVSDVHDETCFLSAFPVSSADEFWWVESHQTRYVLFIGNKFALENHCRSLLQNEYGLSAREVELVALLVKGKSLVAAAHGLGIGHETARSQLKSVFMKMNIHSQSELAVTVSRLNAVH